MDVEYSEVGLLAVEEEGMNEVESSLTVVDDVMDGVVYTFLQQQNAKLSVFPVGQLPSVLGRKAHSRLVKSTEAILHRDIVENS